MVKPEPSVFLFVGREGYLKENAIKDFVSSLLDSASKDLDFKIFYGGETNARDVLDYAATFPFLAPKKVAIIRDFDKMAGEDMARLIAYTKNPSRFTNLILDASDTSVIDDLHPAIQHVKVFRFEGLSERELSSWIRRYIASKGKKIEEEAIEALKELQGANLFLIAQELEKLLVFVGENKTIRISDVEALVGNSPARSVFDLGSAIGAKKLDMALKLASQLMLRGKRTYEIVGLLHWHLKRLLRAKVLQVKGESDYSIATALGIKRRESSEFFKQTRLYDIDELTAKIGVLLETDLNIKRSRIDPETLLEFAIIRLCLGA